MEDISEDFALSPRMFHLNEETEKDMPILLILNYLITHMHLVKDPLTEAVCALQLLLCPRGFFVHLGYAEVSALADGMCKPQAWWGRGVRSSWGLWGPTWCFCAPISMKRHLAPSREVGRLWEDYGRAHNPRQPGENPDEGN